MSGGTWVYLGVSLSQSRLRLPRWSKSDVIPKPRAGLRTSGVNRSLSTTSHHWNRNHSKETPQNQATGINCALLTSTSRLDLSHSFPGEDHVTGSALHQLPLEPQLCFLSLLSAKRHKSFCWPEIWILKLQSIVLQRLIEWWKSKSLWH